ncbi:MAG: efflux RND transporter periplasmic adaptor subunit [Spirochaetales bacterium]|nr:efflux RND transporter periplasmic adaptor subunit [Spirochaetales bacterium]
MQRIHTVQFRHVVLLASLSILFISCAQNDSKNVISMDISQDTEQGIVVRVNEAQTENIEERIALSGEVNATGKVSVNPEVSGVLTRVLVDSGDTVVKNQIVAYVDPSRPGMTYAESPVRSKATGTVTSVPSVAGNQVSPQSVIAELGNLDRLEIEVNVSERYLASLDMGMSGWLTTRAFPGEELPARVIEISPVVDPLSRTILVTLEPESNEKIRPGQSVTVELVLKKLSDVTTIPSHAVVERRDGRGIFIAQDGVAEWRPVSTGTSRLGRLEVISGVTPGERVVVGGMESLTNGSSIRVLEG